MGDWYTQYTTPLDQIGVSEGTTCQRVRFIPNEGNSFRMYITDTNGQGQFRDTCGTGEQTFSERNEGTLSFSFPGAPTVAAIIVSCLKLSMERRVVKFECFFQIDTDYTSFVTYYSCFDAVVQQYETISVATRDRFPPENTVSSEQPR